MKLIFPKVINILSFTFKIKQNKTSSGGSFCFAKGEIVIGTKHILDDPTSVFDVICHEVMEAITVATNTRYKDGSCGDNYKFFMDHKEFQTNISLFSITIQKFIK